MFGKQPSKEELSKMLQAKCDDALFLDNTICTLYASQTAPSKPRYKPRKPPADAFQEEISRLEKADAKDGRRVEISSAAEPSNLDSVLDVESLEQEVANFMRNRRRK